MKSKWKEYEIYFAPLLTTMHIFMTFMTDNEPAGKDIYFVC